MATVYKAYDPSLERYVAIKIIRTIDGKEQLRMTALSAVREAVKALENREVVAEILFTGFVMQ